MICTMEYGVCIRGLPRHRRCSQLRVALTRVTTDQRTSYVSFGIRAHNHNPSEWEQQ